MAAPFKEGVDYFPFEVHADVKIRLLMADCGVKGYGILILLWQYIYSYGYYAKWNDDIALLFASNISVPSDTVSLSEVKAVVESCFNRELFCRELYDKYGILTSRGIQKRYFEIVKRRKSYNVKPEYLLIPVPLKDVNVNINGENVCNNPENECNNQQSKVNKNKENEIKQNNTITASNISAREKYKFLFDQYYSEHPDWKGRDYAGKKGWETFDVLVLYDIVIEEPLERYFNKALKYDCKDKFETVVEWATMDGNMKSVIGYGKPEQ